MNVCVIPVFQRPEYLKEVLSNIVKADKFNDLLYVFCLDQGFDNKNLTVIKESGIQSTFNIFTQRSGFRLGKQSYNVLNGLSKVSYQKDVELIYYIEDDIFVGKDFFTFTQDVHAENPDLFAVIGSSSVNHRVKTTDNPNAYYISDKADYQGLGVCFKAKLFKKYMDEHITGNYFNSPIHYCRQFNSKVCGESFAEQDGLIRRVIEKNKLKLAYPHVPRAYHAGIWGYNRKTQHYRMSYEERLKFIQETCYSQAKMKPFDKFNDSVPCSLTTSHTKVENIPIN